MVYVNVQGGTGAGRRQPPKSRAKDWVCPKCSLANKYYWLSCPYCKEARPE